MKDFLTLLKKNKVGTAGFIIFMFFVLIAIFAKHIAPYDPMEILFHPDGSVKRLLPPSTEHLLGTTYMGRDVFSQMVIGSRVAVLVGCISAVSWLIRTLVHLADDRLAQDRAVHVTY